ncbi:hypothetical protein Taro_021019 [Colocasia esculenta]|uniref:Uncharacterized protein n=1 Tax=Colocasia esculenta TaxID=4460 RepID=A0A843UXV0_COLES|nr:hypothetical protein [Colocasia esculenta]
MRFQTLQKGNMYPFDIQKKIVLACLVVHNYILREQGYANFFNTPFDDNEFDDGSVVEDAPTGMCLKATTSTAGEALREEIANELWLAGNVTYIFLSLQLPSTSGLVIGSSRSLAEGTSSKKGEGIESRAFEMEFYSLGGAYLAQRTLQTTSIRRGGQQRLSRRSPVEVIDIIESALVCNVTNSIGS